MNSFKYFFIYVYRIVNKSSLTFTIHIKIDFYLIWFVLYQLLDTKQRISNYFTDRVTFSIRRLTAFPFISNAQDTPTTKQSHNRYTDTSLRRNLARRLSPYEEPPRRRRTRELSFKRSRCSRLLS